MKSPKVYWHPNCSTCKKAVAFLKKKGIEHDLADLRETAPSARELETMAKAYDGETRKLFNTSGQAYREKNLKDRLPGLNQKERLALLRDDGLLVKRPFLLLDGERGLVGFKEADWAKAFSKR